jgi:hypothetical protein
MTTAAALNGHGDVGEVLEQLELEVPGRRRATAEEGRRADDGGAKGEDKVQAQSAFPSALSSRVGLTIRKGEDVLGLDDRAALDGAGILCEVFVDHSVLVGRHDERVALCGEGGVGPLGRGVDQGDDLEPRTELVLEPERVVPGPLIRAKHNCDEGKRPRQGR